MTLMKKRTFIDKNMQVVENPSAMKQNSLYWTTTKDLNVARKEAYFFFLLNKCLTKDK